MTRRSKRSLEKMIEELDRDDTTTNVVNGVNCSWEDGDDHEPEDRNAIVVDFTEVET